jgi:hypothetical protein
MELLKIFSTETTEPIATKLWWNDPWVAPSKIMCGRQAEDRKKGG